MILMAVQWDSEKGFNGVAVKNKIPGIKKEIPEVSENIGAFFDLLKEENIDLSGLKLDRIKELTEDLGVFLDLLGDSRP